MSQENRERHGTISSSSIWKICTSDRKGQPFGAPGLKYLKQVKYEIQLGRPINKETVAKSTSWGSYVEQHSFNKLSTEYILMSDRPRLFHPEYPFWSGVPDLLKPFTVGDCKSPYSLEVFCDKIIALTFGIETFKEEFPEDYWQLLSNAILLEKNEMGPITHMESIIFVPYKENLDELRKDTELVDSPELQNQLKWLSYADDSELPYLIKGGHYKDMNVFTFEIPQADKDFLIERVKLASTFLI